MNGTSFWPLVKQVALSSETSTMYGSMLETLALSHSKSTLVSALHIWREWSAWRVSWKLDYTTLRVSGPLSAQTTTTRHAPGFRIRAAPWCDNPAVAKFKGTFHRGYVVSLPRQWRMASVHLPPRLPAPDSHSSLPTCCAFSIAS